MKTAYLAPLALLIAAGCSQPTPTNAGATDAKSAEAKARHEPMAMSAMAPVAGDTAATTGSKQAMMKMMQGMPPYTGDADFDFNTQMRIHHLAAIDMAEVQLAHGKDAESRALATKIIADQKREVAQIDEWLRKRQR